MVGVGKLLKQAQKMQELKRIQSLLASPRELTATDFVKDSMKELVVTCGIWCDSRSAQNR